MWLLKNTAFTLAEDDILELLTPERVQPQQRLVEDQQFRFVEQRLGDADALQHAARKRTDLVSGVIRHLDIREHLFDPPGTDFRRQAQQLRTDVQKFISGQLRAERRRIRQKPDLSLDIDVIGGLAEHISLTRSAFDQIHQNLDGGGLAGAIRTKETENRPLRNRNGQIIERTRPRPEPAFVRFRQIFGPDYSIFHVHRHLLCPLFCHFPHLHKRSGEIPVSPSLIDKLPKKFVIANFFPIILSFSLIKMS